MSVRQLSSVALSVAVGVVPRLSGMAPSTWSHGRVRILAGRRRRCFLRVRGRSRVPGAGVGCAVVRALFVGEPAGRSIVLAWGVTV